MALYPISTLGSGSDFTFDLQFLVDKAQLYGGGSVRVRRGEHIFTFTMTHNFVSAADLATWVNFYLSCCGPLTRFTLVDPLSRTWTGLFVAVGDGSTQAFDLPITSGSSFTFYVDGSVTAGTVHAGHGTDSRDEVNFGTAPVAGSRITMNATGYLTCWCVFDGPIGGRMLTADWTVPRTVTLREERY